eukprot:1297593-Rhodomonas_salina.2
MYALAACLFLSSAKYALGVVLVLFVAFKLSWFGQRDHLGHHVLNQGHNQKLVVLDAVILHTPSLDQLPLLVVGCRTTTFSRTCKQSIVCWGMSLPGCQEGRTICRCTIQMVSLLFLLSPEQDKTFKRTRTCARLSETRTCRTSAVLSQLPPWFRHGAESARTVTISMAHITKGTVGH